MKKDAQRISDLPIYKVDDVLAVIESKTNGVMDFYNEGWSNNLNFRFYS
ncbi:hypothetical protein [uncultured Clostridium sp.]|nr:hypothetical protein [uncultured Clostridium sp.]